MQFEHYRRKISYLFWLFLSWAVIMFSGSIFLVNYSMASTPSTPSDTKVSHVILITIDTLRADRLGCYGYEEIKTPFIDALAGEGVLFQQAYVPVPVTFPSHVSILAGTYPPFHKVRNNGNFTLNNETVTLAEIFSDHGYQTSAFIGAYVLDSFYGLDQGFHYYEDDFSEGKDNEEKLIQEKRAEQVTNSAVKWLEKNYKSSFFIWLHYFDPHAPYIPPSPFAEKYSQNLYNGEIAYTDHCLGKLFHKLRELGIYDTSTIIVTSDHGESLGEHGELTHGVFIYDVTLRVPLIIKNKSFPASKRISTFVRTIDIAPSILEISGITYTGPMHGKSFLNLIHDRPEKEERVLYCESYLPYYNHGWSPLIGLRAGNWKFIKAPKPELYNLKHDPLEKHNVIQKQERIKNQMEEKLQKLLSSLLPPASEHEEKILPSQAHLEKLMSLGYIVTAPSKKEKGPLSDPKDQIWLLDYLNRGFGCLLAEDPNQAIFEFRALIDQDPENLFAHLILGATYCKKRLYDLALKEFKKVAQIDDAYMDIHSRLASVYEIKGLPDQAIEEYKLAIQKYPRCAENYNLLANIYLKMERYDEAIQQLKKAVELKPHFILAHNNLGLAYGKKKQYALALQEFQEAVKENPNLVEVYNNLGCVYLELGIIVKQRQKIIQIPAWSQELKKVYKQIPTLKEHPAAAFDLAQKAFEDALTFDAHYKEARVNLGITYLNAGLIKKSIAEFQKILTEDPTDIQSRLNLAVVYLQSEAKEEAMKSLQEVLRLDPDNIRAHYYLGSMYLKMGQNEKAITEYRRMIEINPQSTEAHYSLGEAYRKSGRIEQAIDEYRQTLEINPHHHRAKHSLSLLLNPS